MHPLIDPVTPAIELVLEIERVREPTPRHEVGAHEPVRSLKDSLRLRISRLQDDPANTELPAERDKLSRSGGRDRRSRPLGPTPASPAAPDPAKAAAEAREDVRRLLREDQDASDQPRPTQLRGHHIPAALLTMTNRNQLRGSHRSHCTNSPGRSIVRWNVRLTRNRADLANIVIEINLPPS